MFARGSCWRSWKARTWPRRPMRASINTNRRRPPIRPLTGATVAEDRDQGRDRCAVRPADAGRGQEAVRQSRRCCSAKARWRRSWWTMPSSPWCRRRASSRLAQQHLEALNQVSQQRGHARRGSADERGQGALRKRGGAAFLRADRQPHRGIVVGPPGLSGRNGGERRRRSFRSSIFRRWWRARMFR